MSTGIRVHAPRSRRTGAVRPVWEANTFCMDYDMEKFLKLFTSKKNEGNSLSAFWIWLIMSLFLQVPDNQSEKTIASASFLPFGLTETLWNSPVQWTYIVHFPFILLQLRRTAYFSSSISWNFDFWPLWIRSILTQLVRHCKGQEASNLFVVPMHNFQEHKKILSTKNIWLSLLLFTF